MTEIYNRNWADGLLTNQTLYGANGPVQSVVSEKLRLACNRYSRAVSVFTDFPDTQNIDATFKVTLPGAGYDGGLMFRTTYWSNVNDTFGYCVYITSVLVGLGRGSNTSTASWVVLQTVNLTTAANVERTIRVVAEDNWITVYVDGVQYIQLQDNAHVVAGGIALSSYRSSSTALSVDLDDLVVNDTIGNTPAIHMSGLELQVAYRAVSDLRVSGLEMQVAYAKRELDFAGAEVQTFLSYASDVETAGVEVQVWTSTAQIPFPLDISGLETEYVYTSPSALASTGLEVEYIQTHPGSLATTGLEVEYIYSVAQKVEDGGNSIVFMQSVEG